mgnify:FL=1
MLKLRAHGVRQSYITLWWFFFRSSGKTLLHKCLPWCRTKAKNQKGASDNEGEVKENHKIKKRKRLVEWQPSQRITIFHMYF